MPDSPPPDPATTDPPPASASPQPPRKDAAPPAKRPFAPGLLPSDGVRGVLPYRIVRVLAFAIISLSIFTCAFVCLMAVWDYADRDTAWRALTSLGIIAGAMIAFVMVNEVFGSSLKSSTDH